MLIIRRYRKDAGKETAAFEMLRGHSAVIGNVSAHFKSARHFLRMIAFHPTAERKIRWTAEHKIELLVLAQDSRFAKIALTNFVSLRKSIPLR